MRNWPGILKEGEKAKDIQEIINYREALRSARHYLDERPITLSFVRELHNILLNSLRGKDKTPGEFRKDQNWIGKYGCTIEHASFVPPNPFQLQDHLEAWQRYMETNDSDLLLQTAVVHAQFELLHPFKDGNGRIGKNTMFVCKTFLVRATGTVGLPSSCRPSLSRQKTTMQK